MLYQKLLQSRKLIDDPESDTLFRRGRGLTLLQEQNNLVSKLQMLRQELQPNHEVVEVLGV
jgi:hypothetical protein